MAEPPREPGWYRLGDRGWEPVADADALAEIAAMTPGCQDLVRVEISPAVPEVPLF